MAKTIPSRLHLYVETKKSTGRWEADDADTFTEWESLTQPGCVFRDMDELPAPKDRLLFSLLTEGVGEPLPLACSQKGFPDDASPQLRALRECWGEEAYGDNHLTVAELAQKYAELLSDPRPFARPLQLQVANILYGLTLNMDRETSAQHRRVVFWFH